MISFYSSLLWASLILLSLFFFCCIFFTIRGPHTADRLAAINMLTTLVTISVCILAFLLSEDYLIDVALVFSLAGCLAVVVLTRVYLSRIHTQERNASHVE